MAGAEIIVDNLLCFLNTAVNDFSSETLFDLAFCFYSHEIIKQSKTALANLLHKDISWRRDPEKKKKDLKDVVDWMKELKDLRVKVKFVSDSYKGMPPVGLEFIGPLIVNISEEVTKLNEILPNIVDIKSEMRNTTDVVRELKMEIKEINKKFSNAVAGMEEATNDIAQDDIDILSDLRSFRNSIDMRRPSFEENNLGQDILTFSDAVGGAAAVQREDFVCQQEDSTSVPSTACDPSTGAISKKAKSVATNPKSNTRSLRERARSSNQSLTSPGIIIAGIEDGEERVRDNDEWTLVTKKKRQSPRRIGNTAKEKHSNYRLLGSKRDAPSTMRAVRRTADVFLGRVDKEVTVDNIKEYIKDTFDVMVRSIESVEIQSKQFNAFKITVLTEERETLFNAALWPEGMIVNKFYKRRN